MRFGAPTLRSWEPPVADTISRWDEDFLREEWAASINGKSRSHKVAATQVEAGPVNIVLTAMFDGRWRNCDDVMRKTRLSDSEVMSGFAELVRRGILVAEEVAHHEYVWRLASVDENGRTRRTA